MKYRVDIDFIGRGHAGAAYGGFLHAWSFRDVGPREWFAEFRQTALAAMKSRYLPIYRMADGEYRFLMGRKYNFSRRPLIKELIAVTAEKVRLKNPDKWETSWGETYSPADTRKLRKELLGHIRHLSQSGYLACYLNDNGLNAFTEHNNALLSYFEKNNVPFSAENYVPFHFAPSLLVSDGWQDFIRARTILVVTGLDPQKEHRIECTLTEMGAHSVQFLPISGKSSMNDTLNFDGSDKEIDLCLVAAGIGSANILRQLQTLQTLTIDIGGLMNCFVNRTTKQHGGTLALPDFTNVQ